MEKHINITDIDALNGSEVIPVQFDTVLPEFYLRHVIDLASIVGNHHVAREAYISEFEDCTPLALCYAPTFEPEYV